MLRGVCVFVALLFLPLSLAEDPTGLQNDAGSGGDAGDSFADAVPIDWDTDYSGLITGPETPDTVDHYVFLGLAGQEAHLFLDAPLCYGRFYDDGGNQLAHACILLDGFVRHDVELPASGTYYISVRPLTLASYTFHLTEEDTWNISPPSLDDIFDPASPGVSDACAAPASEKSSTSGEGDSSIDGLVWAALRTGFRFVAAWESDDLEEGRLEYLDGDGAWVSVGDGVPRTDHMIVLDDLPVGDAMCFRIFSGSSVSDLHAVKLANAMNHDVGGVYEVNLLVQANYNPTFRNLIEDGIDRYADLLWDASDGVVRSGRVILVYDDFVRHHVAGIPCFVTNQFALKEIGQYGPCSDIWDVHFGPEALANAAAYTHKDGIETTWSGIWMNSIWEANPVVGGALYQDAVHEVGQVLLHELGHYAFGMDDLYVDEGCDHSIGPGQRISVMGSSRANNEFDDEAFPCPNHVGKSWYTPSWTLLRDRFPSAPARPSGPAVGPFGDGGIHAVTIFDL